VIASPGLSLNRSTIEANRKGTAKRVNTVRPKSRLYEKAVKQNPPQ